MHGCVSMWQYAINNAPGFNGKLKGLRPLPPTPADSRIFGFLNFSENVYFLVFPAGFGVWEGLQSIGNGCVLQMDGFSVHFDEYEFIFDDFHYFDYFASVFDRLTLFPEDPRTFETALKVPGPCEQVVRWCDDACGRSQDPP